jgi:hypothetical protein
MERLVFDPGIVTTNVFGGGFGRRAFPAPAPAAGDSGLLEGACEEPGEPGEL